MHAEHSPDARHQTVSLQLTLRYSHALGERSPYFAELVRGRLVTTRCLACGRSSVPPRLVCTCGSDKFEWIQLSGTGTVEACTVTSVILPAHQGGSARESFLMVRFDGADNAALVRSGQDCAQVGKRVMLRGDGAGTTPTKHPAEAMFVVAA